MKTYSKMLTKIFELEVWVRVCCVTVCVCVCVRVCVCVFGLHRKNISLFQLMFSMQKPSQGQSPPVLNAELDRFRGPSHVLPDLKMCCTRIVPI